MSSPFSDREVGGAARVWRMLRAFGPAAVVASVSIGAGETIIVVRSGAWMGYGLLWLVLLAVLVKGICVPYFLGRYTAISGEPIGERLVTLPGPRGWLLLLLVALELVAAGPLWAALARPSGELIGYLIYGADVGMSSRVIATAFVAVALLFSFSTSYKALERQQIAICGVLVVGTMIGTALVRPDLVETVRGLFSFGHIPPVPENAPPAFQQNAWQLAAVTFGYVGGSVMTYLVYPSYIALHGWGMTGARGSAKTGETIAGFMAGGRAAPMEYLPREPEQVKRIRRGAAPVRWDIACGAAVLLVVTASFMMAGAAAFYARRQAGEQIGDFKDWHLLTDQAAIWDSIHPWLVWVYYVCVLAALWGTLQSYPDIYTRGIQEYAQVIWPRREWRRLPIQLAVCAYVMVTATAVVWSNLKFDLMTLIVSFLATTLSVAIAMLAGLWLNFQLPAVYRTRWWMLAGGVLSAGFLMVIAWISGAGIVEQIGAMVR